MLFIEFDLLQCLECEPQLVPNVPSEQEGRLKRGFARISLSI
jgi:hypothetical protein